MVAFDCIILQFEWYDLMLIYFQVYANFFLKISSFFIFISPQKWQKILLKYLYFWKILFKYL